MCRANTTWMKFAQRVREANTEGLSNLLIEQMALRPATAMSRAYVCVHRRLVMAGLSAEIAADPKVVTAFPGSPAQAQMRNVNLVSLNIPRATPL
jgi:ABC-type branched-subunit amino acid transport system ATPase component